MKNKLLMKMILKKYQKRKNKPIVEMETEKKVERDHVIPGFLDDLKGRGVAGGSAWPAVN